MPEQAARSLDEKAGYLRLDMAVDAIVVGARHRRDLGDIDELAGSIDQLGMLQPITVTPDGVLVCGWRRLEAIRRLGWATVRVWVRQGISDRLHGVLAERDEEALRKPLDDVEAASLYREVKQLLAEDAARRQQATQFQAQNNPSGTATPPVTEPGSDGDDPDTRGGANLAPPSDQRRRSRDQAARLVTGRKSYTRLERVNALQDIAKDAARPDRIRAMATDALARIKRGESVFSLYDQVKAELAATDPAAQAVEPVTTEDVADVVAAAVDRVTNGQATPPTEAEDEAEADRPEAARPGRRHSLRAWVLLWEGMDGWWEHYDPADVAHGIDEDAWETFERVLAHTDAFATTARAVRDRAAAAARDAGKE
ncbi:hypothetical protein GCM10028784_29970 [Myceligenerans cantabricum]